MKFISLELLCVSKAYRVYAVCLEFKAGLKMASNFETLRSPYVLELLLKMRRWP